MGTQGAGGPPSLRCGGERCSLVGGEWGRAGLNECPLSRWMLGTRSQERPVHVVPLKAQSRSSGTKLLVILHRLQAASHLGDFVPTSPLPGWHSLPRSRLTPPHPGPGRGDPDTPAGPAGPPGSVTGLSAPGQCPAPHRP